MKRILITAVVILGFALSPNLLQAQWAVGPHIVISVPNSDFANVSGTGGGFGIKVIRNLSALGPIGLRGDFAFINYGRTFEGVPNQPGLVAQVSKGAFRLTFGPDVTFGTRSLKFHVGALGGFYFFKTDVNIQQGGFFLQDTRDNEVALGWNLGGGFQYDIGLGPLLDVDLRYQTIFDVSTPGTDLTPKSRITAREITLKVGVIFFLGR